MRRIWMVLSLPLLLAACGGDDTCPCSDSPPSLPLLVVSYASKELRFEWSESCGATLYRLYEERLTALRSVPPPPGWDGVYVASTK